MQPFTSTGFDKAEHVGVGTVIEKIYFVITGHYGIAIDGVNYEDHTAALRAAVAMGEDPNDVQCKHAITIDCRWTMKHPEGSLSSSTDTVAERFRYLGVEQVREHLALRQKYRMPKMPKAALG